MNALETDYCIHQTNMTHLQQYSEQQLVDCVNECYGCNGGNQYYAYSYYMNNTMAVAQDDWPYTERDWNSNDPEKGNCTYDEKPHTNVTVQNFTYTTYGDANSMKQALENNTLAVLVQANQYAFQMYSGGIFDNTRCGTNLDHATNVVGWGIEAFSGVEYWIMRNSWGDTWGEKGYMKLEIIPYNHGLCGIQMYPLYPITMTA